MFICTFLLPRGFTKKGFMRRLLNLARFMFYSFSRKTCWVKSVNILCHSYRLSPSNQASLTIFDKGRTLKLPTHIFCYISNHQGYISIVLSPFLHSYPYCHPSASGCGSARQEIRTLKNNQKGKNNKTHK